MAGKKQQQQQEAAVVAAEGGAARRMWRVVRAVLYMLRRGVPSGRKLAMDLHLLLHRGKIAGAKALGDLLALHGHRGAGFSSSSSAAAARSSSFSCRAIDPALAVQEPRRGRREVEFSCSTTPSAAGGGGHGLHHLLGAGKRRRRHQRDEAAAAANGGYLCYNYDAAEVARVFELLNDTDGLFNGDGDEPEATAAAYACATPSPAQLLWALARSPAAPAGKPRITDSPSPLQGGDDAAAGAQVDRRADEFIRRFYEQLRAQRSAASTPDCYGYAAASPYVAAAGRAPRQLAAGIA
ncbi:hypothetical protein ACP4OV_009972 [Aristida adscensionis]